MLPHLRKYISLLEKNKSKPNTRSFLIIEEHIKDPLLGAKLAFFKTLSSYIQPLLREYQDNLPLAPFLYTSLRNLIIREMERFVIPDKVSPSLKVLIDENLLVAKKIDIGIGAKCEIKKCADVTSVEISRFRNECRKALKCFVERLLERSPVHYEATKYLTCLDPTIAYTKTGQERFEKLVILLVKHCIMSSHTGETAQKEFKMLCSKDEAIEEMKNFKRCKKNSPDSQEEGKVRTFQLDHFWLNLVKKYFPDGLYGFDTLLKQTYSVSWEVQKWREGFLSTKNVSWTI